MAQIRRTRLKVPELKAVLKRKGISCSDKRKDELLLLVGRADVYEDLEPDDREESEKKRRCVSVTVNGVSETVDLRGKKVSWTDNLNDAPVVRDGNIFAYLMHHCQWGWTRVNSSQEDDGYKMFLDQHVEKLRVGKIHDHSEHVYVEGSVRPEQRQTDTRYNTWLLVSTDALIESAGCQCVAAYVQLYFCVKQIRRSYRHYISISVMTVHANMLFACYSLSPI